MRLPSCSNIVDFVGAGEVKPGETPGAYACEFVVQVCISGCCVSGCLQPWGGSSGVTTPSVVCATLVTGGSQGGTASCPAGGCS